MSGTVPGPRRAHSATLIGTRLYIFGGGEVGGKPTNDTFVLDVGTDLTLIAALTFPQRSSPGPASRRRITLRNREGMGLLMPVSAHRPRRFHSATAIGNKIAVFGGSDTKEVFSDLCVLDTGVFLCYGATH